MIKWDKIWHFKHVWSNLSNLKKQSSPPSIALSIQKQEVNLVLPWICKVNYPKRSSYIMRDKLIVRSIFYTNFKISSELCSLLKVCHHKCVRGVIYTIKSNLSTMPSLYQKAFRGLRLWSRHPLQSSSSPLSAIGSCLDTLTWDNADPPRSFHVTLS